MQSVLYFHEAENIMGCNCHSINDVSSQFDYPFSDEQISILTRIPFQAETLEACSESHLLVPGVPLSLLDIQMAAKTEVFFLRESPWYFKQNFARELVKLQWYLVSKHATIGSSGKTFDQQVELIKPGEFILSASELAYVMALHYQASSTSERLVPSNYVRTANINTVGRRVIMGSFDSQGIDIDSCWDDLHFSGIELIVAKSP